MSMYLEFEPHSYYYEFAIKHELEPNDPCEFRYEADGKVCIVHGRKINPYFNRCPDFAPAWEAFIDDGNSYTIVELYADTLKELKRKIVEYWLRDDGKHVPAFYEKRLRKSKEAL